ncbi:hypothetical protein [uncultured Paracoccus sp.]|uniref:hypothetical protein n=1 Tax=uncultured Paracoccus sp. TaxID=189685 RepID=UPI002607A2A9|nr:hypothetical protein [uncultured Paracoccus sp.]
MPGPRRQGISTAFATPPIGMQLGFALQDRLDVVQFRRWTQILLVISGANLVRRAFELWS